MASNIENMNTSSEPDNSNLLKRLMEGLFNSSKRPKTPGEFGLAMLKTVPSGLVVIRSFMKEVNWRQAQGDVLKGLDNTIVIVGQPNSGKSTLFNTLKGAQLSPVSAVEGTTRSLVRSTFGPFILIDTPGHLPELMQNGIDEATVVVLLIDATKGLQDKDKELYSAITTAKKTTIVAVNKVDMLNSVAEGDRAANEVAVALGVAGVIPIAGRTGQNVAEELIPALIEASPEAALVIGRELPAYRRAAAQRIIRNSTLVSLAAGMEPIPLVDIPILLGTQMRLVLRIAALYGEPMDSADAMKHAKELIATAASGAGMRILAEQAAKAVPFGGDFIAGAIAGAATWAIGQVALEYYEGGKQINPGRLRQLYTSFYRRFRRSRTTEELHTYVIEGDDKPLAIEAPKTRKEA
ncbi:MAG TPA: GTPase [Ktedonobacteraceae bacterium]|nr:GTPase [Ktedonobacteraceae bacterium]